MSHSVLKNRLYVVINNKFILVIKKGKSDPPLGGNTFFHASVARRLQYKFCVITLKLKKLKCFFSPCIILPKTNQTKTTSL